MLLQSTSVRSTSLQSMWWQSALVDAVDACARVELAAVHDDELAADLRVLSSVARRAEALCARIVAEQLRRRPNAAVGLTRALKRSLGVSGGAAKTLTDAAEALSLLPACAGAAVAAGRISVEHLRALRAAGSLPDAVQAQLVDAAATEDPDTFRRRVQRTLQEHDRDNGKKRAARQHAARGASWREGDDGMHELRARLSPEHGSIVRTALQRVMDELWRAQHPNREPERVVRDPHGTRLADALVEMARRTNTGGTVGGSTTSSRSATSSGNSSRPAVPLLLVLIDYETLHNGLHDKSVCQDEWGNPLDPATVRRLACEAEIIPIVLGGDSVPVDMGRKRRLPTPAQRLAVIARDKHCTAHGCTMPPAYCQLHHDTHWTNGGPTDLTNLRLLCHQHHREAHGHDDHDDHDDDPERGDDGDDDKKDRPP